MARLEQMLRLVLANPTVQEQQQDELFQDASPPPNLCSWDQSGLHLEQRNSIQLGKIKFPDNHKWDGTARKFDLWATLIIQFWNTQAEYYGDTTLRGTPRLPESTKISRTMETLPLDKAQIWMAQYSQDNTHALAGRSRTLNSLRDYLRHFRRRWGNLETEEDMYGRYHNLQQTESAKRYIDEMHLAVAKLRNPPTDLEFQQHMFAGLKQSVKNRLKLYDITPGRLSLQMFEDKIIDHDQLLYRDRHQERPRQQDRSRHGNLRTTRQEDEQEEGDSEDESQDEEELSSQDDADDDKEEANSSEGELNAIRRKLGRLVRNKRRNQKKKAPRTSKKEPATDDKKSKEKTGNTSSFKCYNCGEEGHYSRNCPEEDKRRTGKGRRQ
jgi:Zinc knuckle